MGAMPNILAGNYSISIHCIVLNVFESVQDL